MFSNVLTTIALREREQLDFGISSIKFEKKKKKTFPFFVYFAIVVLHVADAPLNVGSHTNKKCPKK